MGGLFRRARGLLGGKAGPAPARPQSYSLRCPEGHRLSGQRTDGYQALRCPTCGEGVFVLPRSPLPDPGPGPDAAPRRQAASAASDDPWGSESLPPEDGPIALSDPPANARADGDDDAAEIEWVDDDAPEASAPAPAVTPFRPADPTDFAAAEIETERRKAAAEPQAPTPAPAKPARSRPAKARPAPAAVVAPERPRVRPAEWARARRNPLIFGSVTLVVLLTIGYRNWSAWRGELPGIAERGRAEGLVALEEGRFDAARQLLGPARRAVEILGGDYDPAAASAIRQAADEVAILTDLAPNSLEAMLEEAARSDPEDWARTFDTLYKGRAIIVEDQFQEVPDGTGRGRYDLYYRILRPGEGTKPDSVGRIDLRGFALVESRTARVDDYALFGARLAEFRFDHDANQWVVRLEPDSGVVMTHRKALDALKWPGPGDPEGGDRP